MLIDSLAGHIHAENKEGAIRAPSGERAILGIGTAVTL